MMETALFVFLRGEEGLAMPLICEGCGQRVPIPAGHRRNKIQCACGVICTVPESERPKEDEATPKKKPVAAAKRAVAVEEKAERWLLDDEPSPAASVSEAPIFRDADPIEETTPASKPAASELRFACRRCGRPVRRQRECPECNPETRTAEATGEEPVWCPSVDVPDDKSEEDEDDASPYTVEGEDDVKCPKCGFILPPGSVLCVRCGFHLKRRKKIAKTYQPIERVWETNGSYSKRLLIFWTCLLAFLGVGIAGVVQDEVPLHVFLAFSVVIAAMLAFLLGTFDRIHLLRDARGRVQLTKMWRAAFFARRPQTINVHQYEGVVSGRHRDISPWDISMLLFLFCFGVIPGIIWWYFAFYKITYHVSLSRDHGFPAYIVYSGWSDLQMKEIALTLRDASGLPYDEG
jgi:hypothetical protein